MYQPVAETIPVEQIRRSQSTADILIKSLRERRKDILKSKESALAYLESIGITVDDNGNTKVTPL